MKSIEKLHSANNAGKYICVGLDTDSKKLPNHLASVKKPVVEFNKKIIEATKNSAAAYKLNLAFYESEGIKGLEDLEETLSFIPENILTIADGKRGDIGNTSNLYARSISIILNLMLQHLIHIWARIHSSRFFLIQINLILF